MRAPSTLPYQDQLRLRYQGAVVGREWGAENGLNLKEVAAQAGHPTAQIWHYGTRLRSWRVARDVLVFVDDRRRQLVLPFMLGPPPGPRPMREVHA